MNYKDTIIEHNVVNQSDLLWIEQYVRKHGRNVTNYHEAEGPLQGIKLVDRHFWHWDKELEIKERLLNSLNTDVMNVATVEYSFVLDSFSPYEIHNDLPSLKLEDNKFEPWYFIIIPLHSCNSKTIYFEQCESKHTHFLDYKNHNAPLETYIDDEYFQTNLNHLWNHDQPYLTLECEFTWQQGSAVYGDIRRFHCSNNFAQDNIKEKSAIVIMTKK